LRRTAFPPHQGERSPAAGVLGAASSIVLGHASVEICGSARIERAIAASSQITVLQGVGHLGSSH
jgi:hypothetical protein